jgi:hypothetical protein
MGKSMDIALAPATEGVDFLRDFSKALADLVPEKTLTDLEKLDALQADLAIRLSRGTISLDEYKAKLADLSSARATVAPSGMSSGTAGAIASGIANGPNAAISAISMAGPWGAIAGAVLNFVKDAKQNLASFSETHLQIMAGLGSLPETIGDHLKNTLDKDLKAAITLLPNFLASLAKAIPSIFSTIATEIPEIITSVIDTETKELPDAIGAVVQALAENLPSLIGALVGALINAIPQIVSAFIEELIRGVIGLVDAIVDMFTQIFQDLLGTGEGEGKTFNQGGIFDQVFVGKKEKENGTQGPSLFSKGGWFDTAGKNIGAWFSQFSVDTRSYDTGGYVNQTGMALVHQGERIIPASGTSTGTAEHYRGGGGTSIAGMGGDIVIRIDADSLARAMRAQSLRGLSFGAT